MRRVLAIIIALAMNSCSVNNSAHGQENDYEYEAMWDERYESDCQNCDEID